MIYTLHAFSPGAGAIFRDGKRYYLSLLEDPADLLPIKELMVLSLVAKHGYQQPRDDIHMEPGEWPEKVRRIKTR